MVTLVEMMNEKAEGIGEQINGYKLSGRAKKYMQLCDGARKYCDSLMEQTKDRHLGFVPLINATYMTDNGTDPRLWLLIYEDIMNDPDIDIPIEVLVCLRLTAMSDHLKCRGVRNMITDDGEIEEWAYGFAIAGIEEDWWEHDDLVTLPDREKGAVEAMAAAAMMGGMMDEIAGMMGGGDGPDEGWFA